MYFPTWVDLKGEDAVPDTVHHVVVPVDPRTDTSWHSLRQQIQTDGVHSRDNIRPGSNTTESLSEAAKVLKGEYCVKAIDTMKMDQAIIFCRTKVDCDNLENYLVMRGKKTSMRFVYSLVLYVKLTLITYVHIFHRWGFQESKQQVYVRLPAWGSKTSREESKS